MADVTLNEVVQLAEKLTPEDQQALIAHLQEHAHKDIGKEFDRLFNLFVFDVGEWPQEITLRRKDEYGDSER